MTRNNLGNSTTADDDGGRSTTAMRVGDARVINSNNNNNNPKAQVAIAADGGSGAANNSAVAVADDDGAADGTTQLILTAAEAVNGGYLPTPAGNSSRTKRRVLSLRKVHFYVATLTYSLNAITLWRLPYIYSRHGALFLIPLIVCAVFITCPLLCCELFVGQLVWSQSFLAWPKLHPALCGLGLSAFIFMLYVTIYTSAPAAWSLAIAWHSLYNLFNLANNHNDDGHRNNNNTDTNNNNNNNDNQIIAASSSPSSSWRNLPWISKITADDLTTISKNSIVPSISGDHDDAADLGLLNAPAAVNFVYHNVLTVVGRIELMNNNIKHYFVCEVLAAMVLFWIIVLVLLLLRRHLHKVTLIVTSVFFAILIASLLLAVILSPISSTAFLNGVKRLFRWHGIWRLIKPQIWLDAATHSVLAVGLMSGYVWVNAAHLRLRNDFKRDAFLLTAHHIIASLMALLICYFGIGYYATPNSNNGNNNSSSSNNDSSLAIYDDANEAYFELLGPSFFYVAVLGLLSNWSTNIYILGILPVVFFSFFTLLQACCHVFNIVAAVNVLYHSRLPSLLRNNFFSSAGICLFLMVFSHPFTTSTGVYLLQGLDDYILPFVTLSLGVAELFLFAWIYSWPRVKQATTLAVGSPPSLFWAALWRFVAPCLTCFIVGAGLVARILCPPQYIAYLHHSSSTATGSQTSLLTKTSYPIQMVWMDIVLIALAILPIFVLPLLRKCGVVIFPYAPLRTEYDRAASTLDDDDQPSLPSRNGGGGGGSGFSSEDRYNFPYIDAPSEEILAWEHAQREQIMYETLHNGGGSVKGVVTRVAKLHQVGNTSSSPAAGSIASSTTTTSSAHNNNNNNNHHHHRSNSNRSGGSGGSHHRAPLLRKK